MPAATSPSWSTAPASRSRSTVSPSSVAGKLNGRIRLEQRWREHVDGTGWRVRPYLKYSLPIAGKTALNLSSEPFFNLNTTPFQRQSGLDRMRNLVTISTPLTKSLTGEAGYMNQHGFVEAARTPATISLISVWRSASVAEALGNERSAASASSTCSIV